MTTTDPTCNRAIWRVVVLSICSITVAFMLAVAMSTVALSAPAHGPGVSESTTDVSGDPVPVPAELAAGMRNSAAVAALTRHEHVVVDQNRLTATRMRSDAITFVTAETSDPSAVVLYGAKSRGGDDALLLRFLGNNRIRIMDKDGNGLEAVVVADGDRIRFENAQPISGRLGVLPGLWLKAMGIEDAHAASFVCWANCVLRTCPTWSWCWWRCGISCGTCLSTGFWCGDCGNCIGSVFIGCLLARC